jgi:hypothetical protein
MKEIPLRRRPGGPVLTGREPVRFDYSIQYGDRTTGCGVTGLLACKPKGKYRPRKTERPKSHRERTRCVLHVGIGEMIVTCGENEGRSRGSRSRTCLRHGSQVQFPSNNKTRSADADSL